MRYKGYLIYTTIARIVSDAITLYLCFLISFWVRFHSDVFPAPLGIPAVVNYIEAFFIGALILLLVFKSFGLYNEKKLLRFSNEFYLIIKAMSMGVIMLMALTFAHRGYSYSRLLVPLVWFFGIIGLTLSRYLVGVLEQWLCQLRQEQKKILVLGTGDNAKSLLWNFRHNTRWGYEVIGFLSRYEENIKEVEGIDVLGDISKLGEILDKKKPDEVLLTITGLSHDKKVELVVECEKRMIMFKLVPDMFEIMTSKVDVFDVNGIPLLGLKELPLEYVWNRFVKRFVDIAGSVCGVILSSPVYMLLPIIIKFTSKGPVFYRQERCGEDGKIFTLYKFRTMGIDAEKTTGPIWAKEDDPRCTKVGKILRKTYLDELPQLFNVLKGDMSLVGPRPERPNFVEQFKDDIPRYMSRHLVKSGMTGWSQVNGLRGNTPLKDRIKYDMYYIENWSVWFDLKIIFITIFAKKKFAK
jgi:exopolysaccharide biosynthesis polyprenyl glycosylphosphotransferase